MDSLGAQCLLIHVTMPEQRPPRLGLVLERNGETTELEA
jgi:hypothetical protein